VEKRSDNGKPLSHFDKSVLFLNFHASKGSYDEGLIGRALFFLMIEGLQNSVTFGSCIKTCFLLRPLLVPVRLQKIS
jgi:hypothetical protein